MKQKCNRVFGSVDLIHTTNRIVILCATSYAIPTAIHTTTYNTQTHMNNSNLPILVSSLVYSYWCDDDDDDVCLMYAIRFVSATLICLCSSYAQLNVVNVIDFGRVEC